MADNEFLKKIELLEKALKEKVEELKKFYFKPNVKRIGNVEVTEPTNQKHGRIINIMEKPQSPGAVKVVDSAQDRFYAGKGKMIRVGNTSPMKKEEIEKEEKPLSEKHFHIYHNGQRISDKPMKLNDIISTHGPIHKLEGAGFRVKEHVYQTPLTAVKKPVLKSEQPAEDAEQTVDRLLNNVNTLTELLDLIKKNNPNG